MRKTLRGTAAVFIFSSLILQFAARWSPVLYSRLSPPGGRTTSTTTEDPISIAVDKD